MKQFEVYYSKNFGERIGYKSFWTAVEAVDESEATDKVLKEKQANYIVSVAEITCLTQPKGNCNSFNGGLIEKLVETKEEPIVEMLWGILPLDERNRVRTLEKIQINDDLWLSVQASYIHYCTPKKTIEDLSEYLSMEFALLDKEENFLSVTDVMPEFPKLREIEGYKNTTYAYVPVPLIEELYQALVSISN